MGTGLQILFTCAIKAGHKDELAGSMAAFYRKQLLRTFFAGNDKNP